MTPILISGAAVLLPEGPVETCVRVEDGRIADNPVFVDFASVAFQLGKDVFDGHGWEQHDIEEEGGAQTA